VKKVVSGTKAFAKILFDQGIVKFSLISVYLDTFVNEKGCDEACPGKASNREVLIPKHRVKEVCCPPEPSRSQGLSPENPLDRLGLFDH
jgi:hypothetical protein